MKHLGLFEGIGGFSLAAKWMGWETVAWCEWNEFGQKILKYHFPNAEGHGDITKTDFKKYANKIDIVTGGFPCQPYSAAGKRKGKEDERHLWPEMLRAIREIQPRYVVGENVRGLTNWNGGLVFNEVQADLENIGFEVLPFLLPACSVNAPHRRDRVWFIAYNSTNTSCKRCNNGSYNRKERYFQINQRVTTKNKSKRNGRFGGAGAIGSNVTNSYNSGFQKAGTQQQTTRAFKHREFYKVFANTQGNKNKWWGQGRFYPIITRFGNKRITSNSENFRYESPRNTWKWWSRFTNSYSTNIITNTNCRRQSCEKYRKKESRWFTEKGFSNYWENFPTQPPVCGGNDGLPNKLDGITFSKWRNESIKAYGNAIVPQVAYQIFKVIDKMAAPEQP